MALEKRKQLAMVAEDEWLEPVEAEVERRHAMYLTRLEDIERNTSHPGVTHTTIGGTCSRHAFSQRAYSSSSRH